MTYTPPSADQLFVLKNIADIDAIAAHEKFAAATSDMVEAIVHGIGEFAADVYAPLNRVGDQKKPQWNQEKVIMPPGFKSAYQAFVKAGWGRVDGPQAYGGQGLPFVLATLVSETLGSANMAFGLINLLTPGAIHALMAHGSLEQKEKWLPRLVSGEWNGTMNLTEPQAGSDVGALRSIATPITQGKYAGLYRIKGQKIFITFGEHDLTDNIVHLLLARTPGAPEGTHGISLFVVPKYRLDQKGQPSIDNKIRCVSIEHKLGIHASPTCIMAYGQDDDEDETDSSDKLVDKYCLGEIVGEENGGMRAMFTMMNNARLMVGSQGVQIAERATQQALLFAAQRVQSPLAGAENRTPVTINRHPDVRRMLWRMRAQTQAARALVYYAASRVDFSRLDSKASETAETAEDAALRAEILTPLAKAHATDIGCEVASLGIQVHGGMGFIEETGAAQHYRDARIAPIYEGTNGIQAADLVTRKLGMARGEGIRSLIADIADMDHIADKNTTSSSFPALAQLCKQLSELTDWLERAPIADRLAGSYPYLTMLSVATCGWLMAQQHQTAQTMLDTTGNDGETGNPDFLQAKIASTQFYCQQILPEATGLAAAVVAGDAQLPNCL